MGVKEQRDRRVKGRGMGRVTYKTWPKGCREHRPSSTMKSPRGAASSMALRDGVCRIPITTGL